MRLSVTIVGALFALGLEIVSGSAKAREVAAAPRGDGAQRELVFVEAGLGPAYVDTLALRGGALLDPVSVKSSGSGLTLDTAAGVRLQEFTLALRWRYGDFSDWQLWTLGGEAGMNFRLGRFEPSIRFGAGYAAIGGLRADTTHAFTREAAPAIDIHGLNLRASVGLSYYVSSWFSIGGNLSGDAFFLRRAGDRLQRFATADPNAPSPFPYALDGSANGLGVALTLVLGLHY